MFQKILILIYSFSYIIFSISPIIYVLSPSQYFLPLYFIIIIISYSFFIHTILSLPNPNLSTKFSYFHRFIKCFQKKLFCIIIQHQSTTFSNNSHIKMLFPRITVLYKIFRSFPMISYVLSSATFMNTSTPITIPSIYLPPLSLSRSFLATYLLRSGE